MIIIVYRLIYSGVDYPVGAKNYVHRPCKGRFVAESLGTLRDEWSTSELVRLIISIMKLREKTFDWLEVYTVG